ncbi:MAG: twin-arginine translocase subunit TatC [Candidatus Methanofastidiosia archaeon]
MTEEKRMSLVEHLSELRSRILHSILPVFAISVIAFTAKIPDMIIVRMKEDLLSGYELHAFTFQEALLLKLKLSIYIGIILSFPIILYEIWSFLKPGLTVRERKLIIYLYPSVVLFLIGVWFAYEIMPLFLLFFIKSTLSIAQPLIGVNSALSFILSILLIFGIIFQLPLVVAILTKLGLVNYRFLASKRRYAFVLTMFLGAFISDPSPFTMLLVSFPMYLLYEISIWISRFLG